jgi:hypothetical protein
MKVWINNIMNLIHIGHVKRKGISYIGWYWTLCYICCMAKLIYSLNDTFSMIYFILSVVARSSFTAAWICGAPLVFCSQQWIWRMRMGGHEIVVSQLQFETLKTCSGVLDLCNCICVFLVRQTYWENKRRRQHIMWIIKYILEKKICV